MNSVHDDWAKLSRQLYKKFLAQGMGHHKAEERAQDALVILWKQQVKGVEIKNPVAFGNLCARHKQIDEHRRKKPTEGDVAIIHDYRLTRIEEVEEIEAEHAELRKRYEEQVVPHLSADQQLILYYICQMGMTQAEIGDLLGLSRSAVYHRKRAAVELAKDLLKLPSNFSVLRGKRRSVTRLAASDDVQKKQKKAE